MYMLEIAEEEGTRQQNWVTQHKDWKRGNMDVILGSLLNVTFYGSCSFALKIRASRKSNTQAGRVWAAIKKTYRKKKRGLSGNKGRFHLCNLLSARQDRQHRPLRAWEGACPSRVLDPSPRGLKTNFIQRCCLGDGPLQGVWRSVCTGAQAN